ncbi:MAG: phosphoenolpyruvate synthase [Candidatus Kapaibacterium sp.]
MSNSYVLKFEEIGSDDTPRVGGKNASLGEMISRLGAEGIEVPLGFATTSEAYRTFISENELEDGIRSELDKMNDGQPLEKTGKNIRRMILKSEFPGEIRSAIESAYSDLCSKYDSDKLGVAVRSSATAEDLPEASFAGQQETYLNVSGKDELLEACRKCYASLFTDRAISYRDEKGFGHLKIALSAGVQKMVRSDKAGSGVMFTLDTDTGFRDVVMINAAWGLGENVVQGTVNPDEYMVFKPLLNKKDLLPIVEKQLGDKKKKMIYAKGGNKKTKNTDTSQKERQSYVLSDNEIIQLARWAVRIEKHYDKPMDIEWAKDGETGDLYIVQARPETVQSQKKSAKLKSYKLKESGNILASGLAIGEAISSGAAQIIHSPDEIDKFEEGNILVTGMTDPDWVPIMKKSSGIVTDYGGRTSHAAIVSRELGVAAVVGAENATDRIEDGRKVTISCAEGETGKVYEGLLDYESKDLDLSDIPDTKTQIMMNIASPSSAYRWWRLPADGIGLARMEFIINNMIKIHPMALVKFDELEDDEVKSEIAEMTRGYDNKEDYFVDHLARGIARIASAQYPNDVIVRMSDFKTNEYADLIGGEQFEPKEANPMLGFRGASRYYSPAYREGFALECRAIRQVRSKIGLDNVVIMIPFCRTVEEADKILDTLKDNGLERGKNELRVYMMCEIPSNIMMASEFAERFDGFSIGSNDLTQLTLGVDRDSDRLSDLFDERNDAVKRMISILLEKAQKADTKVGICGQAPSDYPEFAAFLVERGIDSISLNPDSVMNAIEIISKTEKNLNK